MAIRPEVVSKFRALPLFDSFIVALYEWIEGHTMEYDETFTITEGICGNYSTFGYQRGIPLTERKRIMSLFRRNYGTLYPFNRDGGCYQDDCDSRYGTFVNKKRSAFVKEMYNVIMADK